jgi:ABC-2 type transport system ATP-binding protein
VSESPAIEARALSKRYGSLVAVDRLELAVHPHRITGFLGRNGAGKSTTIKLLLGMIRPTSGSGRVLGHCIDDPQSSLEIRRRIAYVGEDKGLYGYMTVGELIRFTRSFYADWDSQHETRLLAHYELPIGRKIKALSKGMRTKLALLLALARRPAVLILDEPTEGLDPVAIEQLLRELAGRTADGTTIFFSSHQLDEVERIADDIVMIDRGRVVLETSLDELREHYRAVTIGFAAAPASTSFDMPGVRSARVDGRQASVLVSENVDAIVQRAHSLGATSVQIANVTLREVFLDRVTAAP